MAATENSAPGAKESRAVITRFHTLLNSPDLIPEQSFRRNSGAYPLVCYVNNIVGLFLSKNYEAIPIFLARAAEHMATYPPSPSASAYYSTVTSYLSQVTYHLRSFIDGIEIWDQRIPKAWLEAGPQKEP